MSRADPPGRTVSLNRRQATTEEGTLSITVVEGADRGLTVSIASGEALIGRSETADVRLTDATASLVHAEVRAHSGAVLVTDLKSLNGTWYGGALIEKALLASGSELQMGSSLVRVESTSKIGEVADSRTSSFGHLAAASGAMRALFALLERVSPTDLSILIEGSDPSEEYLVALSIHEASGRAGAPLVPFDCAAGGALLAEEMLFGKEEPVPTAGVLESGADGTVFLIDVGELSLELQEKFARALDTRVFTRCGGAAECPMRARFLASSSQDLRVLVNTERFREDLYDRLAQVRARIPPLGERPEDIPALAYEILQKIPADVTAARTISREAMTALKRRARGVSLRQVQAMLERAALVAAGPTITAADLAFERMMAGESARAPRAVSLDSGREITSRELPAFHDAKRSLVDDFERGYLATLLARCGDNLLRASNVSGIERHHLRNLLRKHGLREGPRG